MKQTAPPYCDLTGEVAVVTGGLGLLGSQYVQALSSAGAGVAIFDIKHAMNHIVSPLIDARRTSLHIVDITKKSDVKRGFDEVEEKWGTPTILINNAGIDIRPDAPAEDNGPFEDYPEGAWDLVIDSHLKGMFFVSQEFLRRIGPTGKKGSIINISSHYGVVAPDQSLYEFRRRGGEDFYKPVAYSVAKSGVLNFTRWLAEYCGSKKIPIRVNTLVPGGVRAHQDGVFEKEYAKRTIVGRMAEPHEYNGAILFLASHAASSYMTGATLIIDGGWTAR